MLVFVPTIRDLDHPTYMLSLHLFGLQTEGAAAILNDTVSASASLGSRSDAMKKTSTADNLAVAALVKDARIATVEVLRRCSSVITGLLVKGVGFLADVAPQGLTEIVSHSMYCVYRRGATCKCPKLCIESLLL